MDCGKKMKAGGVPFGKPAAKKTAKPGDKPNPFASKKAPPFGKKAPAFAEGGTVRGMGAATKGGKFSRNG